MPLRNAAGPLLLVQPLDAAGECDVPEVAAKGDDVPGHAGVVNVAVAVGVATFVVLILFAISLDVVAAIVVVVVVVVTVAVAVVPGLDNITVPIFGMPPLMRGRLLRQTEMLQFSEMLTFGKLCTFGFELKQAVESNDLMR